MNKYLQKVLSILRFNVTQTTAGLLTTQKARESLA